MSAQAIFLTHAEVEADPSTPVPEWALSATGAARHEQFAHDARLKAVRSIFSSTERKAIEAAAPASMTLDMPVEALVDLGENDRSATGYLPADVFWPVVDQFFAQPDQSVRGWETARAAQARIVGATKAALSAAPGGDVLIVAHGGVGALLRCHLMGVEITKSQGQPHSGGGCWFAFDRTTFDAPTGWRTI
ncbi:MAG: histidine phosphatase family protein [Pseudomonadota bacterium]